MTLTHQLGPYPQTKASPDCINFRLGHPSPSLLPAREVGEMAQAKIADTPLLLQYGKVRGYEAFRESLAAWLSDAGGTDISAAHLFITGGTSTALAFACQVFARPGDRVLCGDPTYFLAQGIFETHGLDVEGIPVDAHGMSMDALREALARPGRVALIYCMPSFHNPCSVTMPTERRRELIELADEHDAVILADEPYNLLAYDDEPPAPLFAMDEGRGRVLSLGSFSKLLAPGIRLGWALGSENVLSRLADHGAFLSGGGLNPLMSATVHGLIESGFQQAHLSRLLDSYRERRKVLCTALREHIPTASFTEPSGGYFTWVDLGPGVSTQALLETATAHGVAFAPGNRCAVTRDLDRFLRLSLSFYEPAEIQLGIERLAAALDSHGCD